MRGRGDNSVRMPTPTKRTPAVVEEVLSRIAKGETLAAICRSDEKFPCVSIWLDWVAADETLSIAYARARDIGADAIAEEALAILDEEPEKITTVSEDGSKTYGRRDSAHVQWQKNRFEGRLKLLAKWNPKKYGERQTLDLGNKEGETLKIDTGTDAQTLAIAVASQFRLKKRNPDPVEPETGEDLI